MGMRDRNQHIDDGAYEIDPEIAEGLRRTGLQAIGDAARQSQRDTDTHGRRDEIVPGEPRHLRQIAHRRFAAVGLPVGIRGETRRRVKCEVRGDRRKILRVETAAHVASARCRR